MAEINRENLVIKCNLCQFKASSPAKFFMHAFFKHQSFAFVRKQQYLDWPIRCNEFNETMIKLAVNIKNSINFEELENVNLFDESENKCVDCNVDFKNDDEKADHYMNHHLIYFPSLIFPLEK